MRLLAGLLLLLGWPRPGQAQPTGPASRFLGSVPDGPPTDATLRLSLKDALDRALTHNLALRESEQDVQAARAARLRALDALMPHLHGELSEKRTQINLAASALSLTIPGVHLPTIVGPFGVGDARVYATQSIFNWSDLSRWNSTKASERAARDVSRSDRELVILVAGNAYLTVISDRASVDSTRAQLGTARTLHERAVDRHAAGVVAQIDVLRARVELQTQQQRLIAAENQFAVDMIALARVIGLPKGQAFEITDTVPYAPLDTITLEEALQRAIAARPDYLAAKARVRAAELQRESAAAGSYPWLSTNADYGDIGSPNFGRSHSTFSLAVTLTVPIFRGTRVRADTLEADATMRQRQAELADLETRVDAEVRTAFLNVRSSSELVAVAQSNVEVAGETLVQARDRFIAGVATNLDVVQAQESVASAQQAYISSLYAYNLAKISLAQAIGIAEQAALHYLGAK